MGDVVVGRYTRRHEAELARQLLEAAGIPCALFADDAGGWYAPLLTSLPARIVVRDEDAERAREILDGGGLYLEE